MNEDRAREQVVALEQAVERLRAALIGVAERQEGDSRLPCYCIGPTDDGHQDWCANARAALAATEGQRLGRPRRVGGLIAALGLLPPSADDLPSAGATPNTSGAGATPSTGGTTSSPDADAARESAGAPPADSDDVLAQVRELYASGDEGGAGDRVACEHCGRAHPLEAKNSLLWYRCSDGDLYLGGIDGRLLVPRSEDERPIG